jgi:hypothetical protein
VPIGFSAPEDGAGGELVAHDTAAWMNGEAVAFWRRLGTTPGWAERYVGCQGRLGQMETGPRQEKKKREPVLDWVKLILGLESKKKEYGLRIQFS